MAQRSDIRVRLIPEGLSGVVKALRQVNKEAGDAQKGTSKLFAEVKALLPTIGFGALVTGFGALVRSAANYADEIGKMGARVGASAENLSVLNFAAKTADVGIGELEAGLIRLARQLDDLRSGGGTAISTFRELNLTAADFEGRDTSQAFALIAERLGDVEDGSKRTALAFGILGDNGARMLPLVNDLAEKGFKALAEDAEAAGAVISTELALAAASANDSLTATGILVQSLALRLVSGLAPQVNAAMTDFQDDIRGKGLEPMKEFGDFSGRVIRVLISGFTTLGRVTGSVFTIIGKSLGAAAAQFAALLRGDFGGVREIGRAWLEDVREELGNVFEAVDKGLDSLQKAATDKPIDIKVKPSIDRQAIDETAADAQKQLQQRLDALAQRAGGDELKSLNEIAARRRAIAEQAIEVERQRAEAIVATYRETLRGQQALAAIESSTLRERARVIGESFRTEGELIRQRSELLSAEARKQFGDTRANQQLQTEIARQATNARLTLAQKHYGDLAKLQSDYLGRYKAAQEAIRQVDQQTADLRARHESIFTQAAQSRMSVEERAAEAQRQGFERVRALRAAVLAGDLKAAERLNEELLGVVQTLAQTEGFEGVARQISDDVLKINELSAGLQKAGLQQTAREAETATKSLDKQLDEALATVKDLQTTLLKGMRVTLAADQQNLRGVVDDIQKAIDARPYSIRVSPTLGGSPAGQFAEGGAIPGTSPTPTSDDKLIRATSGEFMQPVAAVRKYGLSFMESVRTGRLDVNQLHGGRYFPRYALGGPVTADDFAAGVSSNVVQFPSLRVHEERSGSFDEAAGSRDTVDVNLSIGGERVSMHGDRAEARKLVKLLDNVARGTTR